MAQYRITYTSTEVREVIIDADNADEARERFFTGEGHVQDRFMESIERGIDTIDPYPSPRA